MKPATCVAYHVLYTLLVQSSARIYARHLLVRPLLDSERAVN